MEQITKIELQAARDEALAIENKIGRLRALHGLRKDASYRELGELKKLCHDLSKEIIEDVMIANGLTASRHQTVYFSKQDGIISPSRLGITKLEKILQFSGSKHFIHCGVSPENLADHGHICLDKDRYSVILAAPYGTTSEIRAKFIRVVDDFPVELEFSPGNGLANHHTPRHARGIAIRSARSAPICWPDYYYEYAETVRTDAGS